VRIGSFLTRRKSILFGWLLSYLLILAVPLAVTFLTQARTAAILEKEITDAHLIVLRRIRERMDAQVETAWRLTQEIAFSPRLTALTRGSASPLPGGYGLYELSRDLRTYRTLYASVEDVYVYLPRIDSIISGAGLVDSRAYHQTYLRDRGIPFEAWHREISLPRKGDFVLFAPDSVADADSIVYVQSTPLLVSEPDANVAISLSKSSFVEDARDIATLNSATVLVLDSSDRVIAASAGPEDRPRLRYRDLPEQEGLIRVRGGRGPAIGSSTASTLTDWKYVVIVPREAFWRKAEAARRLALAGFFICVLLGGVVVVTSLKRNYDPVGELVAVMERFQGRNFGREENEFSFIRRAMAQAQEEREKYGIIVAQQDRALKENLLRRLLKGALPPGDTLSDRLFLQGIRLIGDHFLVAALYVGDYDEVFAGDGPQGRDAYEEYRKVQFIMGTAFEELLVARKHRGFAVDVDDMLVVLVNLDLEAAGRARSEIEAVAEIAAGRLGDGIRVQLLTAVSAVHRGIGEIPQAYAEALQTMEHKRLLGIEGLSHFEDLADVPRGRYHYPPETERRLINAVRTGEASSAVAIIRDIFDTNFAPGRLSPAAARCLMFDVASTMIKAVDEIGDEGIGPTSSAGDSPGADPVERLVACETAQELERELIALVEARCAAVHEEMARRGRGRHRETARRLTENVAELVARQFADPGLDISALARTFDVHPISLSRIFAEETGEGLLDRINRVRIERAKALMSEDPSEPLEEICRKVGYGSTRTFTRAFKRREGVTPGLYKASLPGEGPGKQSGGLAGPRARTG